MRVTSLRPTHGPGGVPATRLSGVMVGLGMTTSPKLPRTRTLSCEAIRRSSSAKLRESRSSPLPVPGVCATVAPGASNAVARSRMRWVRKGGALVRDAPNVSRAGQAAVKRTRSSWTVQHEADLHLHAALNAGLPEQVGKDELGRREHGGLLVHDGFHEYVVPDRRFRILTGRLLTRRRKGECQDSGQRNRSALHGLAACFCGSSAGLT